MNIDWHDYLKKTNGYQPSEVLLNLQHLLGSFDHLSVVDCGCGAGNDLEYLLKHGAQVTGFDASEQAVSICAAKLSQYSEARCKLAHATFNEFDYQQYDIALCSSSLYFCHPALFDQVWRKIIQSIKVGGYFCGTLLGDKDSWNFAEFATTSFSKAEALELFKDFEIITFDERDKQGISVAQAEKHWHSFSVIAQKTS